MSDSCNCCDGIQSVTPETIYNRPGLSALHYRAGTHFTFLESMEARLSNYYLDIPLDEVDASGNMKTQRIYPLKGLKTRDPGDPSIALLDSWAMVADVMTFYQERIANEGYLRTATERRSILELARLVAYQLRPGVSASVYLAYTLDKGSQVDIPAGARSQNVPGPGELPQSFETSEPLKARGDWNNLQPRLAQPQNITLTHVMALDQIYVDGTNPKLKTNDPLLFVFGTGTAQQALRRVDKVIVQSEQKRSLVTLVKADDNLAAIAQALFAVLPAVQAMENNAQNGQLATEAYKDTLLSLQAILLGMPAGDLDNFIPWSDLQELINEDPLVPIYAPVLQAMVDPALQPLYAALTTAIPLVQALASSNSSDPKVALVLRLLGDFSRKLTGGITYQAFRNDPSALKGKTNLDSDSAGNASLRPDVQPVLDELDKIFNPQTPIPQPVIGQLIAPLQLLPTLQPLNSLRLGRSLQQIFRPQSDIAPQLLANFAPRLAPVLYEALANAQVNPADSALQGVYALRLTAPLFGHNTPPKITAVSNGVVTQTGEWPVVEAPAGASRIYHESAAAISLDSKYDQILPLSWMVIKTTSTTLTNANLLVALAGKPDPTQSRADYGMGGSVTNIQLVSPDDQTTPVDWIVTDLTTYTPDATSDFKAIRQTVVYAQSDPLTLVDEPILDDIGNDPQKPEAATHIELDGLYDGLQPGRWVIVSGERTDIPSTSGVDASELVMLAAVEQKANLPGDKLHTTLSLANQGLSYLYKRASVVIYGNVVKATHGETRKEVLGGGDGSQVHQTFTLKQSPLTYVSAPTPSGVASTLKVYVNLVQWHETDSLAGEGANDQIFTTQTDNASKTSVIFGNGVQGARLPTGAENVSAVYRTGIGQPGNVKATSISLLSTRPLGVKAVINPLPASGGADPENRDQARRSVPLALLALDRLVSIRDYADFARTFGGIGKASAVRLTDGLREVVHLTIAGAEDIPIDPTSDLYANLRQALLAYGDPYLTIQVDLREVMLLVVEAGISLQADYLWEGVEPQMRAAMLDTFSFDNCDLGQNVYLSEVIRTLQQVPGVAYVDIQTFKTISQTDALNLLEGNPSSISGSEFLEKGGESYGNIIRNLYSPAMTTRRPREFIPVYPAQTVDQAPPERLETSTANHHIFPAQLAYLSPAVPDTLILKEITA
jgi:hypothetical protein